MEQTNYKVTVFKQLRAILILVLGSAISFLIGIYSFTLFPVRNYIPFLIVICGVIISIYLMKVLCYVKDKVELFDTKFISDYYGVINFKEIKSYYHSDTFTYKETLLLKLHNRKRVVFVDNIAGQDFYNFRINLWTAILQSNTLESSKIKDSNFLNSKYAKPFGIVIIALMVIGIIWSIIQGDLSFWGLGRAFLLFTVIVVPILVKIFGK